MRIIGTELDGALIFQDGDDVYTSGERVEDFGIENLTEEERVLLDV